MRTTFNRSLSIEGRPEKLSADAGVIALRELDSALGVVAWLAAKLFDPRDPRFITHPLVELLRTRLYLMAQGHGAQDHVDRLRDDPACRLATSSRRSTTPLDSSEESPGGLASQPTQSRLVATLSSPENRAILNQGLFESARRHLLATTAELPETFTIDVDSLPIDVHGQQDGSAYNGYYERRVYHPLVTMLGETGHWLSAQLREGNVGTADGAEEHLLDVVARVQGGLGRIASIRGDAGYPGGKLLSALEREEIPYVFRLKTNKRLEKLARPYVKRPVGRPPNRTRTWFHELSYAAESWSGPRRVVLVVIDEPENLFGLRHFFLVTNWEPDEFTSEQLLAHYRQRGTMEGHIGELSSVLAPALSCTSRPKLHVRGKTPKTTSEPRDGEAANAATFLLYAHAYNLSNSLRLIMNAERPNCAGSHDENAGSERKAGDTSSEAQDSGDTPAEERAAADTTAAATCGCGHSLSRIQTAILRAPARFVVSGRRVTMVLAEKVADLWCDLWRGLERLRPTLRPAPS